MKTKKVPWDVGRDGVFMGLVWVCVEKGRGEAKHAFWQAAWHTFIISRTFARGRYSLIVSETRVSCVYITKDMKTQTDVELALKCADVTGNVRMNHLEKLRLKLTTAKHNVSK